MTILFEEIKKSILFQEFEFFKRKNSPKTNLEEKPKDMNIRDFEMFNKWKEISKEINKSIDNINTYAGSNSIENINFDKKTHSFFIKINLKKIKDMEESLPEEVKKIILDTPPPQKEEKTIIKDFNPLFPETLPSTETLKERESLLQNEHFQKTLFQRISYDVIAYGKGTFFRRFSLKELHLFCEKNKIEIKNDDELYEKINAFSNGKIESNIKIIFDKKIEEIEKKEDYFIKNPKVLEPLFPPKPTSWIQEERIKRIKQNESFKKQFINFVDYVINQKKDDFSANPQMAISFLSNKINKEEIGIYLKEKHNVSPKTNAYEEAFNLMNTSLPETTQTSFLTIFKENMVKKGIKTILEEIKKIKKSIAKLTQNNYDVSIKKDDSNNTLSVYYQHKDNKFQKTLETILGEKSSDFVYDIRNNPSDRKEMDGEDLYEKVSAFKIDLNSLSEEESEKIYKHLYPQVSSTLPISKFLPVLASKITKEGLVHPEKCLHFKREDIVKSLSKGIIQNPVEQTHVNLKIELIEKHLGDKSFSQYKNPNQSIPDHKQKEIDQKFLEIIDSEKNASLPVSQIYNLLLTGKRNVETLSDNDVKNLHVFLNIGDSSQSPDKMRKNIKIKIILENLNNPKECMRYNIDNIIQLISTKNIPFEELETRIHNNLKIKILEKTLGTKSFSSYLNSNLPKEIEKEINEKFTKIILSKEDLTIIDPKENKKIEKIVKKNIISFDPVFDDKKIQNMTKQNIVLLYKKTKKLFGKGIGGKIKNTSDPISFFKRNVYKKLIFNHDENKQYASENILKAYEYNLSYFLNLVNNGYIETKDINQAFEGKREMLPMIKKFIEECSSKFDDNLISEIKQEIKKYLDQKEDISIIDVINAINTSKEFIKKIQTPKEIKGEDSSFVGEESAVLEILEAFASSKEKTLTEKQKNIIFSPKAQKIREKFLGNKKIEALIIKEIQTNLMKKMKNRPDTNPNTKWFYNMFSFEEMKAFVLNKRIIERNEMNDQTKESLLHLAYQYVKEG